jgi:hypothetical protein
MSFCIKRLETNAIRVDDELQPRVELCEELIEEYGEAMERGAKFPPVEVMYDGTDYWLWDGFHRYLAAQDLEAKTMLAHITSGTRQDAVWKSLSANATHGLRRSNKDKASAICKALRMKSDWTDPLIAEHVGVSDESVRKYRAQLESAGTISSAPARLGLDGKKYEKRRQSRGAGSSPRHSPSKNWKVPRDRQPLPLNPDELWSNKTELRVCSGKVREVKEAMSKAADVAGVYDMVRYVRHMVMRGYEAGHPVYRFLDAQQFTPALDCVMDSLKEIVPTEVCGYCGGEGCDECGNRGWVGQTAWEKNSGFKKELTASTELITPEQEP